MLPSYIKERLNELRNSQDYDTERPKPSTMIFLQARDVCYLIHQITTAKLSIYAWDGQISIEWVEGRLSRSALILEDSVEWHTTDLDQIAFDGYWALDTSPLNVKDYDPK